MKGWAKRARALAARLPYRGGGSGGAGGGDGGAWWSYGVPDMDERRGSGSCEGHCHWSQMVIHRKCHGGSANHMASAGQGFPFHDFTRITRRINCEDPIAERIADRCRWREDGGELLYARELRGPVPAAVAATKVSGYQGKPRDSVSLDPSCISQVSKVS